MHGSVILRKLWQNDRLTDRWAHKEVSLLTCQTIKFLVGWSTLKPRPHNPPSKNNANTHAPISILIIWWIIMIFNLKYQVASNKVIIIRMGGSFPKYPYRVKKMNPSAYRHINLPATRIIIMIIRQKHRIRSHGRDFHHYFINS